MPAKNSEKPRAIENPPSTPPSSRPTVVDQPEKLMEAEDLMPDEQSKVGQPVHLANEEHLLGEGTEDAEIPTPATQTTIGTPIKQSST